MALYGVTMLPASAHSPVYPFGLLLSGENIARLKFKVMNESILMLVLAAYELVPELIKCGATYCLCVPMTSIEAI